MHMVWCACLRQARDRKRVACVTWYNCMLKQWPLETYSVQLLVIVLLFCCFLSVFMVSKIHVRWQEGEIRGHVWLGTGPLGKLQHIQLASTLCWFSGYSYTTLKVETKPET